jgi:hypothetical protein
MRGRPRGSAGSSLVEVVVALVVLEVGVLAVLGMLLLAGRTLARAALLERAVSVSEVVMDSLLRSPGVGAGERTEPPLRIRWRTSADLLEVEVLPVGTDSVLHRVGVPLGEAGP